MGVERCNDIGALLEILFLFDSDFLFMVKHSLNLNLFKRVVIFEFINIDIRLAPKETTFAIKRSNFNCRLSQKFQSLNVNQYYNTFSQLQLLYLELFFADTHKPTMQGLYFVNTQ